MWMKKHLGGLEINILLGGLKNMWVSNKKFVLPNCFGKKLTN